MFGGARQGLRFLYKSLLPRPFSCHFSKLIASFTTSSHSLSTPINMKTSQFLLLAAAAAATPALAGVIGLRDTAVESLIQYDGYLPTVPEGWPNISEQNIRDWTTIPMLTKLKLSTPTLQARPWLFVSAAMFPHEMTPLSLQNTWCWRPRLPLPAVLLRLGWASRIPASSLPKIRQAP